jgi:SAM-dependent methyltransferase
MVGVMEEAPPYYQKVRSEMKPFLPDRYSKVLEVGCGAGNFRTQLTRPCEYWGVELVEAAANAAATKLTRVLRGTFQDTYDHIPNGCFDLVICNDVIEHMADHEVFFQDIRRKMAPGSYLVGSVPNVRYVFNVFELLVKKDWAYRDEGILDRGHLRFFTERSLKRTILSNGFTIEAFAGINRSVIKPTSLREAVYRMFTWVLGRDSQFTQFGFRIKLADHGVLLP